MNILVTGGAGFIGSHLVPHLLSRKHKVTLLVRPSTSLWRIDGVLKKLSIVPYSSYEELKAIFNTHFDMVIHMATRYIKTENGWKDVQEMSESNVVFPSVLLELAVNAGVKYFINTGTCFEYSQSQSAIYEHSPIAPLNFYASTKVAFEKILEYYCRDRNIRGLTLKLFFPYGDKDNNKVVPYMIKSILAGQEIGLTNGEQRLDFTHVDDIVSAYMSAVNYISSRKATSYEVFNIGSGKTHTLRQIAALIKKISGKEPTIRWGIKPYAPNEIMNMRCSWKKAYAYLGWRPKMDIKKGLAKTYRYYVKARV